MAVSFAEELPTDWSLVAWGESSEVYVYNDDGSESEHFAKSERMKQYGPKDKPALDLSKLKKFDWLLQPEPTEPEEVPDPQVPKPKQ